MDAYAGDYSTTSWNNGTWYALYNGSNVALAFKTPTGGGSPLVVSTSGTTTLKSGVTVSGGSNVTLSNYGSGGGNRPGGGWGRPQEQYALEHKNKSPLALRR